jgi:hypothetical protein
MILLCLGRTGAAAVRLGKRAVTVSRPGANSWRRPQAKLHRIDTDYAT